MVELSNVERIFLGYFQIINMPRDFNLVKIYYLVQHPWIIRVKL